MKILLILQVYSLEFTVKSRFEKQCFYEKLREAVKGTEEWQWVRLGQVLVVGRFSGDVKVIVGGG